MTDNRSPTGRPASPGGALTLIDTHHHVLNWNRFSYPWVPATRADLHHNRGAAQYRLESGGMVSASLLVQATTQRSETDWLLGLAALAPEFCGVIGWMDTTSSSFAEELSMLLDSPRGGGLVGLRHPVPQEESGWLRRHDVRRGLTALAARGLPFDLLVRERDYSDAMSLVASIPSLMFVLNHLGCPVVDGRPKDQWIRFIHGVSRYENVRAKVSGLSAAPLGPIASNVDAAREHVATAFDAFGAERLVLGSDWPVSVPDGGDAATVLGAVIATLDRLQLSAPEQRAIFAENAIDIYRLQENS